MVTGGAANDDENAYYRHFGGDRRPHCDGRIADRSSTGERRRIGGFRANQELLQRRIDQLAQGLPEQKQSPGIPGAIGTEAIPGQAIIGGSFPRSFLIPGTDTSIRVGGFVDITGNYFLQGANTGNPGIPTSNFGQNGNLNGVPVGQMFVPGLGNVPQAANHSRGNGVFEFSPQQSRLNVETRTPTAWGESRTFFEFDWAGSNTFSAQTAQQAGGDSLLPRLRFAYGTLGGFLAGQAISNFSDADADTESMEFGGGWARPAVAHPAGALHSCGAMGQRLLGVGGTADRRRRRSRRPLY